MRNVGIARAQQAGEAPEDSRDEGFSSQDLQEIYHARFAERADYRRKVWMVLSHYFSQWIPAEASVLDMGSGWCEFINTVRCNQKYAMDMNPDVERRANDDVKVLRQDCTKVWDIPDSSLDVVFTSNFLEHLSTRIAVEQTLVRAYHAIRPGGRLIALGPNIKYLAGTYWDFFDHYTPLTELSLSEALRKCGFGIEECRDRFLPYTMSEGAQYPIALLRLYLTMPLAWRIWGKQFLIVARKRI